jgi:hypothetical protein
MSLPKATWGTKGVPPGSVHTRVNCTLCRVLLPAHSNACLKLQHDVNVFYLCKTCVLKLKAMGLLDVKVPEEEASPTKRIVEI